MLARVKLGCMVEIEPTRAKFKIWGQHEIRELTGVNLRRGSNLGLNTSKLLNTLILIYVRHLHLLAGMDNSLEVWVIRSPVLISGHRPLVPIIVSTSSTSS